MKVELPYFAIADIFPESLVLIEEGVSTTMEKKEKPAGAVPDKPAVAQKKKFYLGDNFKKIAVLVDDKDNIFLDDECLAQLTKILTACKVTMADIALINIANTPVDYSALKESLTPSVYIFFGVEAKTIQLPFTIPYYQVQNYAESKFIFSPSLISIKGNTEDEKKEKMKLWNGLKKIFNI